MTFKATYLGSNGWIIEFSDTKIIIDPWLTGDLVFPLGNWFFKGSLEKDIPTPNNINLIVITQGLSDHCHLPSLDKLPKDLDIICPKSAIKSLNSLNFSSIIQIEPNNTLKYGNLDIEATSGAPVPQIENGYIIEHKEGSFYIEPHGFLDSKIKPRKLDAVITPTKDIGLPLIGSFVKGAEVIPDLIKTFDPKFILSSTIGGDAKFSGILNKFISVSDFTKNLNCELVNLKTLESIQI